MVAAFSWRCAGKCVAQGPSCIDVRGRPVIEGIDESVERLCRYGDMPKMAGCRCDYRVVGQRREAIQQDGRCHLVIEAACTEGLRVVDETAEVFDSLQARDS